MPDDQLEFTAGDQLPELEITFPFALTGWTSFELHIKYKPRPLVITLTQVDLATGQLLGPWAGRVSTTLAAAASAGDATLQIATADYASMPASGDIELEPTDNSVRETLRYSSKSAPNLLHLLDTPKHAHSSGATVTKLADLRAGKWNAELELKDANGKPMTFVIPNGLLINDDIA